MTDAGASLAHDDVAVSPTAGLEAECVTLKNGVRVVVDPSSAAFCAAGVLINAGTRDEMAEEEGSTLLLEKLALKASVVHDIVPHVLLSRLILYACFLFTTHD